MTHGDKAKAKTGKSSQASGNSSKGSGKGAGKSAESAQSSSPGGRQSGQAEKLAVKKPAEKSVATPAAPGKKADPPVKSSEPKGGKTRGSSDEPAGFANPLIAAAFKRAVQKYPNAFRKLTD